MKHVLLLLTLTGCGPQLVEPPVPPPQQQPQGLTGLPCDVHQALQSACASCHVGAVYIPGFATRDDLLSFGATVGERLGSTERPMPPRGTQRQLSSTERALLDRWASEGMPAGECGALQ